MGRIERRRLSYRGIVQGVGFRPAVYRCAVELGLAGFVQNRRSWVIVEIEGEADRVRSFRARFRAFLPAAARVDEEREEEIAAAGASGFRIEASAASDFSFPPIPPDLAICGECRSELFDPKDRRFLYPFITCTQCGPRYSIVAETPFDRESTSMADFPQCPACLAEYADPASRRFHAQTNSCPACGPRLALLDAGGRPVAGDPVVAAAAALEAGAVVAVQGIGGFHLAADPRRAAAVARLRRDKERKRRPFALMVRDLEAARALCAADDESLRELATPRAPILILPAADPDRFAAVSDTGTLGIMLPYSPLHLLLFLHPAASVSYDCLIMTSGNLKDEPMATRADDAMRKLAGVADLFLCHDRRILLRCDDSVLRPPLDRAAGRSFCQIRRSRGYVPELIPLAADLGRTVLAVGGDLKNAPAFGRGRFLHLAPYVGDLDDPTTFADFESHIERLLALYAIEPELLAYDPHPLYRSREWAMSSRFPARVAVQHHHAHLLSVMAEHGLEESIGLAFDGTGYGSDGAIWGGEFLHATRAKLRPARALRPVPPPRRGERRAPPDPHRDRPPRARGRARGGPAHGSPGARPASAARDGRRRRQRARHDFARPDLRRGRGAARPRRRGDLRR